MKKLIFLFFCLFILNNIRSQIIEKKVNFIIVVNESVVARMMGGLRIKIEYSDSSSFVPVDYIPGNLIMKQSDYDLLFSSGVKSLSLFFDYSEYDCRREWRMYNYEIDLNPKWLKNVYCIMHVYHLSFSNYGKIFNPISWDKNYTYELDSPGYTFRRIRKK